MLKRGLIVSCQAEEGSPFNAPEFIVAFARAAELGGAVAVRICGVENIKAVKKEIFLPIIGITKDAYPNGSVLITPTLEDVEAIVAAGADIVALDATNRIRPNGLSGSAMVRAVENRLGVHIMADVATFDEGMDAANSGADYVGTTLSGYTSYTKQKNMSAPDFDLVAKLTAHLPDQVIAEGRIWTPEQAREALEIGAYAVVVGSAITRPIDIVKRFVSALRPE
ncbi:MAG: N-acetylmannosamine-6-phosphate 2-epimerase [Ignavibacteriae bacterium]|nr:N-acetylmannosamine-6-phosphate 2-epimerase [Ignavibacteriota bacterium]